MEYQKRLADIEHPSVRECLRYMGIDHGLELLHCGDIPARSGIGSSSAFTVGLLNALHEMKGLVIDKFSLAAMAIELEQNIIGECVGSQDQAAAAFGGLNHITFGGIDHIQVQPLILPSTKRQRLESSLCFCFSGQSRESAEISKTIINNTTQNLPNLHAMKTMVQDALSILRGSESNYDDFGKLLDESWQRKKQLSNAVSSAHLNSMYDKARQCGALGGKLCGAGGGGFFLFFIPPEKREEFDATFCECLKVPVRLESRGSHIIN